MQHLKATDRHDRLYFFRMTQFFYLIIISCALSVAGDNQSSEELITTPKCEIKVQPTGTPIPTPSCVGFDTCRTFGGWLNGTYAHPYDAHSFITCLPADNEDGGTFTCGVCHPPLFYSEKCSSCEWNENDDLNVCSTTKQPDVVPTTDYQIDFCASKSRSQNYEDPVHPSYYYACVAKITYHMWCGSNSLFYNASCDACLSKI